MFEINPETDLTIDRLMKCRPETIWRCWSEPELFKQWFTPSGVEVVEVDNDLRPGGRAFNVMKLPDGTLMPNEGCFFLAEPHKRLVYGDGYGPGFRPKPDAAFMAVDLRLVAQDGGTLYAAHIMHATSEQRQIHLDMGFEDGWGTTIRQLDNLARRVEA